MTDPPQRRSRDSSDGEDERHYRYVHTSDEEHERHYHSPHTSDDEHERHHHSTHTSDEDERHHHSAHTSDDDDDDYDSDSEDGPDVLQCNTLIVWNIPYGTPLETINAFFQQFGRVLDVKPIPKKFSTKYGHDKYSGYYVTFYDTDDADACLALISTVPKHFKIQFENHTLKAKFLLKNHRKFSTRKKVTADDAESIYTVYLNNPEEAKNLAASKGYSERTYYNIISKRGQISGKYKHPPHAKKWNDDQIAVSVRIVEENPLLTLDEIEKRCENQGNAQISLSTLQSYLRLELFTLKEVDYQAAARNTEENKERRVEFVNYIESHANKTFIYIDEVGFSIGTRRTRARSKRGTRVVRQVPCLQSPNVSVCAAIDAHHGILHYKPVNGSYTAAEFRIFISELIHKVTEAGIINPVFIFDNCRIHAAADLDSMPEFLGTPENPQPFEYRFLPPYSPNLNPIENVFSQIKSHFKALIATRYYDDLLNTFKLPRGNQTGRRREILCGAFKDAIEEVKANTEGVTNTFNHLQEFYDLVKQHEDI